MAHALSVSFAAPGNLVVDLRRAGTTSPGALPTGPYYKAVKLALSAIKTGGGAAAFAVAPIVVADTDPAPSAATLALAAAPALPSGVAPLDSANNPTLSMGQSYSPGYSPTVFGEVVATHLLVTCTAVGALQIVVD